MSSPALTVSDLTKDYAAAGDQTLAILRGISFAMGQTTQGSESLAITGPSGSGKSTLLQIVGTLDSPTSGGVDITGTDPFGLSEPDLARFRNSVLGFVFQDHHLLPQYNILENVLIPALAFGSRDPDTSERAEKLLERVGLADRLTHRPAELSGGERQRVAVARALINRPSLLLCDEPTGSLDRANAEGVVDLLLDLHKAEGSLLIVVTHSLELADRLDRHCELEDGILIERRTS
jgi:lipoprotein-releasing system ATP-binding protein